MSALTHDTSTPAVAPRADLGPGLAFALASAISFGLAGAVASPLLDAGWSPGAVVLIRVAIGALLVLPLGVRALGGRWSLIRANLRLMGGFGLMAVAVAQLCFFSAVQYMDVAPALLIEYTAPAAIVGWLWLRHGQRPAPITVVGAGLAALGLILVLDLISGADLSIPGVLWALGAMIGLAGYFVLGADESSSLPPLTLAAGGLIVGTLLLGVAGLIGVMDLAISTADVAYTGVAVAWWVPLVVLGVITAAVSYVTGIAAIRRLGSRLASFVALTEVLAAVLWAWLLLGQLPGLMQLAGGALILLGVIAVKLGERAPRRHVT